MDLVEILNHLNTSHIQDFRVIDHVLFGDGHSVSIQASKFHYCTPQITGPIEKYTHFELMLNIPRSDIPQKWIVKYGDGCDIYGNVAKRDIEELLIFLDKKYKMI